MYKWKHSYAKFWLDYLGNKITINNKNFFDEHLSMVKKYYTAAPLITKINIGEDLIDDVEGEDQETAYMPYSQMLEKLKYGVFKMKPGKKAWKKYQKALLYIKRLKSGTIPVSKSVFSARGLAIEWDKKNKRIRGVGEDFGSPEGQVGNGDITDWIYYENKRSGPVRRNVNYSSYADVTDNLVGVWRHSGKKKKMPRLIDELPVMITDEGELLCIPKTRVLPKILIVGTTGAGKSWAMSSISGRVFYVFQHRVGFLNDSLDQFYNLMCPMDASGAITELGRISNEPRHLPVVNLYMSCPNVKMRHYEEGVSYRLVISFKEFLYRYKTYTHGVGKWDLGKPEKYLTREIVNALDRCKTADEIERKLYAMIEGASDDKGKKAMIYKWKAAFESIFRDQFTSNLFRNEERTAANWKLIRRDGLELFGHPFIILMEGGLVPVVNNHLAKNRVIAKKQMCELVNKIVEWQMQRGDDKKPVWVVCDELKDFLGRKGDELYQALDYLFSQGRINKIGFVGNVQMYSKLSDEMRFNSSHLLVFDMPTHKERSIIVKDYNLEKEQLEEMKNLEKHQCFFITKWKTILYDKEGKRIEREKGLWKGKVLPPITCHKQP